jgi:NAD(P)-dependent dehydrogenase (short-subunit alcohol dehydrogenase family)
MNPTIEVPGPASDRLARKVALVVGGGSTGDFPGTGSATAMLLARHGARIGVMGRSSEHTDRTVKSIVAAGGEAMSVLGDATSPFDCQRVVDAVVDRYGRLDVLVNNLGFTPREPLMEIGAEIWDRTVDVNLKAVVLMTRCALPHLGAAEGASVINVGSIAGLRGGGMGAYGMTKGGLVSLTRALAAELGPRDIRVNCIVPGHLHTPMGATLGEQFRELRKQITFLGTEGTGWDLAWAAVFLASDESRYITAVTLPVDGGASEELPIMAFLRLT